MSKGLKGLEEEAQVRLSRDTLVLKPWAGRLSSWTPLEVITVLQVLGSLEWQKACTAISLHLFVSLGTILAPLPLGISGAQNSLY